MSKGETQPPHPSISISPSAVTCFLSPLLSSLQRASGKVVPSYDTMEAVNNANIRHDCGLHDCGRDEVLINSR